MKSKFKVWKTITIGTGKPALKDIYVSDWAKELLSKTKFSKTKSTIDLVKIKVKDLGIDAEYPTTEQIYDKAKELGLELVPAEVGPILRDEYRDQPEDGWLYIGMEPIPVSDVIPGVFELVRNGGRLWLGGFLAKSDDKWDPDGGFVFSFRKSLKLRPSGTLGSHNSKSIEFDANKKLELIKILTDGLDGWTNYFLNKEVEATTWREVIDNMNQCREFVVKIKEIVDYDKNK